MSMIRISTSSWSLHRSLGSPPIFGPGEQPPESPPQGRDLDLLALPDKLSRMGINTLEIVHFHMPTVDPGYQKELAAAAANAGVELFSILIDAGDITHEDPDVREQHMQWIRDWIDVAAGCGAGHARVVGGDTPVDRGEETLIDHPVVKRSAESLLALASYAQDKGVEIFTENFRATTRYAAPTLAILERCEGRVGLCADFGNVRGPDPLAELLALFPHATSVHAKAESIDDVPDVAGYELRLEALEQSGFDGPISLIFDGPVSMPADEWHHIEELHKMTRRSVRA